MSVTPESVRQLLNSADFGDRLRGTNQLRQLEPAIAFELVQIAIADQNPRVRYSGVSIIGSLGEQDRAKSLEILRDRLFHDSELDVQAAAADSMAALHFTEAFEDLLEVYQKSTEWLVQFSIIAALGELGEPRAFEVLAEAIADPNELICNAAIGSLGELGDPRAIAILAPYASNPDWQLRYRVVQALKHLGTEAHTLLQDLANDPVEVVAQEARASLATA